MLWWIVLIVIVYFIVKWNNKKALDDISVDSDDYRRGYRDGYRAHVLEIQDGIKRQYEPEVKAEVERRPVYMTQKVEPKQHVEGYFDKPIIKKVDPPVAIEHQIKQSQAEQLEQKAQDDLRNINTTLYVASFLLVAAAALFIGTSLPEFIKFMGIWAITVAFYSAGLVLYDKVEKLKPAAIAFTGTGLALLPFTGFAMYNFILENSSVCWFITSVISLVAFVFAAMRLKNEVLSYLSIAFGVSLAVSGTAILDAGLIWNFVSVILFGSLLTIVSTLQPGWLPSYFSSPIQKTNGWIVPLTIISSLFANNAMSITDYWIIMLVSAFYYAAVAASSIEYRDASIFIARLLISLSIVLMTYDIFNSSWAMTGCAVSLIGFAQSIISAFMLPKRTAENGQNEIWMWIGLGMQLAAPFFVSSDVMWAEITIVQLLILMLSSFGLAYWLRRIKISAFGTIALAFIPVIFGNYIAEPAIEHQWVSLTFVGIAAVVLAIRYISRRAESTQLIRQYLASNFILFTIESLWFTSQISAGWGIVIWLLATALIYGFMFIERQPVLSIVANIMILATVVIFVKNIMEYHWIALIFMALAAITIALLSVEKWIIKSVIVRPFIVANIGLFIVESLFFTFNIASGWGIALWSAATIMVYILIYLERQPSLSILSNIMIFAMVMMFVRSLIDYHWIAFIFIVLATISIALLSVERQIFKSVIVRPFIVANVGLFIVESLLFTANIAAGWGIALWSTAAVIVYILMYLERQPWLSILSNVMILASIIMFVKPIIEYHWIALIFMILAAISIALLSIEKQITKSIIIRPFIVVNFGLFIIEALSFTVNVPPAWGFMLWVAATTMVYVLMYLNRQPSLSILANIMIWFLVGKYLSPILDSYWISSIFMIFALISVALLAIEKQIITKISIRPYIIINFVLFLIESLALVFILSSEWSCMLWLAAAVAVYCVIYLERQPTLILVANSMLLLSILRLIDILKIDDLWSGIVLSWIAFVVLYTAYIMLAVLSKKEYSLYFWWSAVSVAGLVNFFGLMGATGYVAIAAGIGLAVVSMSIIAEGWISRKTMYVDAGLILATIGLQRAIGVTNTNVDILVYTHWWAAVVALSGYIYYLLDIKEVAKQRSILSLAIISLFGGMAALGVFGDSAVPYQIVFLIEHVIILVIGLMSSKKAYSIWGAAGIVLSVVWMIRGYTFLLLAIAAFGLIGAAIYALINQSKNSK
jgi:hypothetical protein